MDNANPTVLNPDDLPRRQRATKAANLFDALAKSYPSPTDSTLPSDLSDSASSEDEREEIDRQEIFDLIANITDPEHPLSLSSLGVVSLEDIQIISPTSVRSRISTVQVLITPTTSACSLTTVIGLGVKVRLMNALPPRFRIDVKIKEGTSSSADEANKQLGDKERVAAAMENRNLVNMVNHMLSSCE